MKTAKFVLCKENDKDDSQQYDYLSFVDLVALDKEELEAINTEAWRIVRTTKTLLELKEFELNERKKQLLERFPDIMPEELNRCLTNWKED